MNKNQIYNILMSDNVLLSIKENLETILQIIPEINEMIGFEHNHPHHHVDVWNHTLLALSMSPKNFEIRLVLLLHDIGKPHSFQDERVRHFKGHARVSAEIAYSILKRLEFSNDEILKLCYLIEQHDTPITDKEIHDNKELTIIKFNVQCCDALAHNPLKLEKRIRYLLIINEKINNDIDQEKCRKLISKFYK